GRANDSHVAATRLALLREKLLDHPQTWERVRVGIETLLRFHQRRLPQGRRPVLKGGGGGGEEEGGAMAAGGGGGGAPAPPPAPPPPPPAPPRPPICWPAPRQRSMTASSVSSAHRSATSRTIDSSSPVVRRGDPPCFTASASLSTSITSRSSSRDRRR